MGIVPDKFVHLTNSANVVIDGISKNIIMANVSKEWKQTELDALSQS